MDWDKKVKLPNGNAIESGWFACDALQEEQEDIRRSKEEKIGEEGSLSWADTRQMPVTLRVIQETLRVASILSFTFREAVEDVEYQGQVQFSNVLDT